MSITIEISLQIRADIYSSSEDTRSRFYRTIKIIVGTEEDGFDTFETHRGHLCSKSRFFRAELKKDPKLQSFTFPHEDPKIFERIQEWLYTGDILFETEESPNSAEESVSSQPIPKITNEEISYEVETEDGTFTYYNGTLPDDDDDDDDDARSETFNPQPSRSPPTPLDALTLTKIYTFAEHLQIPALCNAIIDLLGQRLGYDMTAPGEALVYAFERCRGAESPLRRLLMDFTEKAAPFEDFAELSSAEELPKELMFELLAALAAVRGVPMLDGEGWGEHFEEGKGGVYRVR